MKYTYEALDKNGNTYMREVQCIGELPTPSERLTACRAATKKMEEILKIKPEKPMPFGLPVYAVFMTRAEAKIHSLSEILMMPVCDLPKEYWLPCENLAVKI